MSVLSFSNMKYNETLPTETMFWPVLCMWEFKLLNNSQKSWSPAMCNSLMTSSHSIWDAIWARCCQSMWSFFVALIFTLAAINPSCLPFSVFRAWEITWESFVWGWEEKGAGATMELKKICQQISTKVQAFFSPSKCSAAILQNKWVNFSTYLIQKLCQYKCAKVENKGKHHKTPTSITKGLVAAGSPGVAHSSLPELLCLHMKGDHTTALAAGSVHGHSCSLPPNHHPRQSACRARKQKQDLVHVGLRATPKPAFWAQLDVQRPTVEREPTEVSKV